MLLPVELRPSKYYVRITKSQNGYFVEVYSPKHYKFFPAYHAWRFTLWGARRTARRLLKRAKDDGTIVFEGEKI